jgi:anti-sigma B factor antagonist
VNYDAQLDAGFDVATQPDAEGATLTVSGEIDVATSPTLRRELHAILDAGASHVVIDLSATTFIDSSGLGVLVGALKRLREANGNGHQTLVLTGLQPAVRKVFEITGLNTLFTIEA